MEAHGEPARAQAGQLPVDPGLRLVQAASRGQRQPLSQPSHRGFVIEADGAAPQAGAVVHPDRIGRGHEDVGGALGAQQGLEDSRAREFGLE
jgi:hypothetical protein